MYMGVTRKKVKPISGSPAAVHINYKVTTAIPCQCKSEECKDPVEIGQYLSLGTGSQQRIDFDRWCHKLHEYRDPYVTAFRSKCY